MRTAIEKRESQAFRKLKNATEAGKRGDYRLAVRILKEVISESDAPPQAWLLLGRSFHALKDYSRALAAFNDYIIMRPRSGDGYLFTGRTYLTLGMAYKAVPFLRKALENNPKDAAHTKALLGTAYLRAKNSPAAVQILQEAVQEAPDDKRIYRAYLNSLLVRGVRLCDNEEYDLGLEMLRFVLVNGAEEGFPNNTYLRLELGRAARETDNLEEALEHFTCALKLTQENKTDSGDRRIRWLRAAVLMALGRNAEATDEIETIRSKDSGIPELPWNSELIDIFLIRSFLESAQWRKAAELCRQWLKKRQDLPMIRVFFAEAMRNLSDFESAHNHLLRALEREPENLELWYADILVCWEWKDFKSLKKALKAAQTLGGDAKTIKRFMILCHVNTDKNTQSNITMLQQAIRSLGPEPELMYAMASSYLKVGLLAEARNWFKKTIRLKDNHESAWLGEIAALEAMINQGASGKTASTENLGSLYKAYLSRWPDNVNIRREHALFLVRIHEYGAAAVELEKLLVWDPASASLRRVLAYSYRKTGRYREAAVFLKALLKENPRDVPLLIEYSGCLERTGSVHYAVAVLEKARQLFSGSCDVSLALGILHAREKKIEKAFDYFREAAKLDTSDPRPYEWMADIAKKNGESSSAHYAKEAEKRKKFNKSR
ncbi:MAG: tetratricopeptide repeat protein [Treponema sp.]|jgi:tetratricopeptide (TPR) repeat protein|nr:tetratricopeptide repeat protein [Treponema sp.]